MSKKNAISPTREEDYPEWYQQVVKAGELAENSPVRGCMVIKPWGYGMWENIQRLMNVQFKDRGTENAYFPLFMPVSYLSKEAEHVEGFAKECAVVTHHRLKKGEDGGLVPDGELEEPLVVRPTSEMIIGEHFSKWIESYRDLPVKINQWANIVRWEMRTRIFLRTAEILWQEGHTAHATKKEAEQEAIEMLKVYADFAKDALAIPMVTGKKTASERFPGADETYTIEAMMQDGKALQSGTSHFLGQNFSKACGIKFRTQEGDEELAWTTSWGTTTRLIGAVIMVHGDDDGLMVPPRIAQNQVVIIPVIHKEETREKVMTFCREMKKKLGGVVYHGQKLGVIVDERDLRGGEKVWGWVKKGIPIRIEVGPREVDEGKLSVTKRTRGHREFDGQSVENFVESVC
ncbi:MAG: proline--tRNA ligase, partial [Simkaniaceae bacterium]|nr:proline--tRNA ligase [Simkaniaceae bacterium]